MQASPDQSVNLSLSSHTIGNAVDPPPPPHTHTGTGLCAAQGGLFAGATPCTSRSHGGQFAPRTPPPPTAHPLGGGGDGCGPSASLQPRIHSLYPSMAPLAGPPPGDPHSPPPPMGPALGLAGNRAFFWVGGWG